VSDWQECKLGDAPFEVIDGDRGTNYPKQDQFSSTGYCLFLNAKNVTTDGFEFSDCYFVSKEKDETLRKGKLQRNDIILTTRGTVGNIAFYNSRVPYEHIRINSGMIIIRPNVNGILPEYTYQLFKFLKRDFDVFATGSAQPQLPIRDLKEIDILLPPLPEQRAIAAVLSCLDDKIDLLNRQNKTLEALAATLWRKMFVEDADPNWKKGKLGDFGQIICGKTPSTKVSAYFGGDIPFIKIPDMHGNTFIFKTEDSLTDDGRDSQSGKTIPKKSICVSCIATVGLVSMNSFDSQTNQQINTIIPNSEYLRYYLFVMLRNMTDDLLTRASGGTATDNLNTGDFSRIEIMNPPEELLKNYDTLVKYYFDKIYSNSLQIRTLSALRDSLLPKLMSGEVRVKL